ncbi:hypothetical protein L3X38_038971 [Prunus dulcis]|uniref:RING-type E3 ubiquitin transferase n=1 Tax=Prunus dulcis TaxID=3755 RepID=A0AAD4V6K0_PRUDU|nr:hypothetical protein L3X38_038971 [Prunus dulcis]
MANPHPPSPILLLDDEELQEDQNAAPGFNDDGEDEDDEDEEEEEEEDEDLIDTDYAVYIASLQHSGVSHNGAGNSRETVASNGAEEWGRKRRRAGEGKTASCDGIGSAESSQGSHWTRNEIDGLFCPICLEAWTNDGDHHICCLPCGHIYGMSCIRKWLQQRKNSGKCPQCNKKCALKDVRKLFASRIVSVDEESQKMIRSLEAKCDSLEKKGAGWCKKEAQWRKLEAELQLKVQKLTERTTYLEHLLGDTHSRTSGQVNAHGAVEGRFASANTILDEKSYGWNFDSKLCGQAYSCNFILEKELQVDGARLFDVDASNQIVLISRRLAGIGGTQALTKLSLIPPYDRDDILLPRSIKVIRDLRICPTNSDLALFACLGKKLSVLSMESNNVILAYDLPAAAWTCSWDLNDSNYVYAGLQNGSLLVFDLRRTAGPVATIKGLTNNPIHTVHSLPNNSALPSGARTVLSASSIGLCLWNVDNAEEGPILVPQTENQGVCISLAYCPSSDNIVASYRPKVEMSDETIFSQPPLTPSRGGIGQGTVGSLVLLKRAGSSNCFKRLGSACTNVCDIGLPKSAIIDLGNHRTLFASEDKLSSKVVLEELPSFTTFQSLKLHKDPVRDLKYTPALKKGLLSCLSGDVLQLFSTRLS